MTQQNFYFIFQHIFACRSHYHCRTLCCEDASSEYEIVRSYLVPDLASNVDVTDVPIKCPLIHPAAAQQQGSTTITSYLESMPQEFYLDGIKELF